MILTDHEYTILSLLRSHKFEEDARIAVHQKYPFEHSAGMTLDHITLEPEKIKSIIIKPEAEQDQQEPPDQKDNKKGQQQQKKKKKDDKLTLKLVLTKMVPYASLGYAEHVLRAC